MTILSRVFGHPYTLPVDDYRGWRYTDPFQLSSWNNDLFDSFLYGPYNRQLGRSGIPIPIQRDASQRTFHDLTFYEETDSESDSDWDDDLNANSLPMRRKRRTKESSIELSGIDRLTTQSPTPPKLKYNNTCTRQLRSSQDQTFTRDGKTTLSRRPIHVTRSTAANNDEVINLDQDDENEINEITSYDVYKHLKLMLQKYGRCIDEITGDGNCFFRALSKVVYGRQKFYDDIRQAVVDVIEKFPKKFEAVTDGPVLSHVTDMRQDKTWATQTEIYAAATLLGRPIYILSPDQTGENYRWLLFSPLFKYNTGNLDDPCYITICHTHGNHYDRVAPLSGKCNCGLDPPELSGITDSVDLTVDENEIV